MTLTATLTRPIKRAIGGAIAKASGWAELDRFFGEALGGERGRPVVTRPYEQSIAVYRCVRLRAAGVASLPLRLLTPDDRVIESGPLVELLAEPSPGKTTDELIEDIVTWLDLTGVAYLIAVERGVGGIIKHLIAVGGPQIEETRDRRTGQVTSYKYTPAGVDAQYAIELDPADVWDMRLGAYDPRDPGSVLSPVAVAQEEINQVYKAALANSASLDNGVEPGGILTVDKEPAEKQRRQVQQLLDERSGVTNRRRALLLWGALKWQQLGASFKDMEFGDLRRMNRNDICAAFGVDPAAIGFFDAVSDARSQTRAAKESVWNDTLLPLSMWVAAHLTRFLVRPAMADASLTHGRELRRAIEAAAPLPIACRKFSATHDVVAARAAQRRDQVFVWFDDSEVMYVRDGKLARAKEGAIWQDKGVPLNQVIDAFDLPFEHQPWGGTWYKPIGLVDVAEDVTEPTLPAPEDEPAADDNADKSAGGAKVADAAGAAQQRAPLTDAQLARLHERWVRSWAGLRHTATGRLGAHMHGLRREALANLDRLGDGDLRAAAEHAREENKPRALDYPWLEEREYDRVPRVTRATLTTLQRDLIARVSFKVAGANKRLLAKLGPLVRQGVQLGGAQSMAEAAAAAGTKPDVFNLDDPAAKAALRRRDQQITAINQRAAQRLRASLAAGLEAGETKEQLADRVRVVFNAEGGRARLIAHQEVGSAVEEARQIGRAQAKVPAKSWLWSRKEEGRAWHKATEQATLAKPVPNDREFVIVQTGNRCMHPRGTGEAKDDINCGCTTVARYPGDGLKDAAVLAHLETRGFVTDADLRETRAAAATAAPRDGAPDTENAETPS